MRGDINIHKPGRTTVFWKWSISSNLPYFIQYTHIWRSSFSSQFDSLAWTWFTPVASLAIISFISSLSLLFLMNYRNRLVFTMNMRSTCTRSTCTREEVLRWFKELLFLTGCAWNRVWNVLCSTVLPLTIKALGGRFYFNCGHTSQIQ